MMNIIHVYFYAEGVLFSFNRRRYIVSIYRILFFFFPNDSYENEN